MDRNASDNNYPLIGLILLYFAFFIVSAAFFQLRSKTPPWVDGSPIEFFTGTLLWMSSLISLLTAGILRTESRRSWLWLVISAGLALLALDEFFALHEKTKKLVGNDDHIKVLQWFLTIAVIYFMDRFERSSLRTRIAFVIGYVIHGIYVLSDIGDGDYFRIPFASISQLRWTEEFLELFALTAYCIGFIFVFTNTLRATMRRAQ